MEREKLQILLNERNTDSAFQSIKRQDGKLSDQDERFNGLHALVVTLANEVAELRQSVAMMRSKISGTGPTSV